MTDPNTIPKSTRIKSYFRLVLALYVMFNLFVAPCENWLLAADGIFDGNWRYLATSMSQGSLFFIAIVLISDAVFRILQEFATSTQRPDVFLIFCGASSVLAIVFTLGRFQDLERHIAENHAGGLPWADQILAVAVALLIGFAVHMNITRREFGAAR